MKRFRSPQRIINVLVPMALASSIALSSLPLGALAAPGDVNSVNNGPIVQGGTYYNTPGDKTTFTNSSGGLWIKNGTTVRGLESDAAGNPNGNGGWLHFYAPGQVVRVDGRIDVSALSGGSGYLGNGGRVTVDAAYLYQNGSIYANGQNGGMVQFNVGAAMFSPNAIIEAKGSTGAGGAVNVNATGVVDFQRNATRAAIVDTSGKVVGTYDTNVINIEGGLINMEGVLRADGTDTRGGTIRLVANGMSDTACVDCALDNATGGVFTQAQANQIKQRQQELIACHDGNIHIGPIEVGANGLPVVNPAYGLVSANGASGTASAIDGQGGGTIIMAAIEDVINEGVVRANGGRGFSGDFAGKAGKGGDGGTVSISAGSDVVNSCAIVANGGNGGDNTTVGVPGQEITDYSARQGGDGGEGGVVAIGFGEKLVNQHTIAANGGNGGKGATAIADDYADAGNATAAATGGNGGNGGNGGLVVLSGDTNPVGNGTVFANGGQGGQGGNADARAIAEGYGSSVSLNATALATAGFGGAGGNAGTIVAAAPATFTTEQSFQSNNGAEGASGGAYADAKAYGENTTNNSLNHLAIASAITGNQGLAEANSYANVDSGNANSAANAITGNYGKAIANAHTDTINELDNIATAVATATGGEFSIADANAYAWGIKEIRVAANAVTGNNGYSIAWACGHTKGDVGAAAPTSAVITALAVSGDEGTAIADALGTSALQNIDITSTAISGVNGQSVALASADAPLGIANAVATATNGGGGFTFQQSSNTGTILTAPALPNPNLPSGTPPVTGNALVQLQQNELILHNENAILLTADLGDAAFGAGGTQDQLTERALSANVRDKGLTTLANVVVSSSAQTGGSGTSLSIDVPASGLNTATVLNEGNVTNTAALAFGNNNSLGGGHVSIMARNGDFTNNNTIQTTGRASGGSINIKATGNATNASGATVENVGGDHGGHVMMKAGGTLTNAANALIASTGNRAGGTIQLRGMDVVNNGQLKANAVGTTTETITTVATGGQVISKAKNTNINNGLIQANAQLKGVGGGTDGFTYGGYVRQHANVLSVNSTTGVIEALGDVLSACYHGGTVILTGGNGDGIDDGTVGPGGPVTIAGESTTDGTNWIPGIDLNRAESAINLGKIDASTQNGYVGIGGDNQVGKGDASTIIASKVDFVAGQDIYGSGISATNVVACTPVIPPPPPLPPGSPDPEGDPGLGLFQDQRYSPDDTLPDPPMKMILKLDQPSLFFTSKYLPVTEEILALALEEYTRQRSMNNTPQESRRMTSLYLRESGVDLNVAERLIDMIEDGDIKASVPVLLALKNLVDEDTAGCSPAGGAGADCNQQLQQLIQ